MAVLAQFEINDQSDQSAKYYREGRRSPKESTPSWLAVAVAGLPVSSLLLLYWLQFDVGEKYPCVEQINMSLDHGH